MPTQNKIANLFDIRPNESRLVTLLLAHSFFIGVTQILVRTSANTLFLVRFDSEQMPFVYIGSAIAAPLVGLLYTRLERRFSFRKLLGVNLGVLLSVLVIFRLLFHFLEGARWPALALFIWYYVEDALLNLEFWGLAGRLLDMRQGKRLFGLIGAGEMVARIIGGFSVGVLIRFISTPDLLILGAGGIVGSVFLMLYITRIHHISATMTTEMAIREEKSRPSLIKNRYVLLMGSLAVLSLVGYYFVDLIYQTQIELRFPGEAELAGFLGPFEGVMGISALFSRLILTGPLISKYGLTAGLLTLPVMSGMGIIPLTLASTLSAPVTMIFTFSAMTKLLIVAFRRSTDRSAARILYQPLPANERLRTQTLVESILEPSASGIAGILLLFLPTNAAFLSFILLVILAVWITVVLFTSREYRGALNRALHQRSLGEFSFSLVDASSMEILRKGLESPHTGEVIYFIDVLESTGHPILEEALRQMLSHPAPEVRGDVLRRIERLGITSAWEQVSDRIRDESSPEVRGVAVRTLAALGETEVFEQVLPYLESSEPPVKMGAMVGLLRSGGIEGILAAGENLIEAAKSSDPVQRRFAAQVLGEVNITNFYRPLIDLLQDDNPDVRRAALSAAGKLKNRKLWPLVVANISVPGIRSAAVTALVAGGEDVIPYLEREFAKEEIPRDTRIRIAQICGRLGGERAMDFLHAFIGYPDPEIRYQVLYALGQCGYRVSGREVPSLQSLIFTEAENATWTLSCLSNIEGDGTLSLLNTALEHKFKRHQEQVVLLLSFIYGSDQILDAWSALKATHSTGEMRAYALEMIDVLISQELRGVLVPLIDSLNPGERLQRLREIFPQPDFHLRQFLEVIISDSQMGFSPWVKTCALLALADIDMSSYQNYLGYFRPKSDHQSRYIINLLETEPSGDQAMLTLLEKVIILKTVDIFSEISDEVLADVANVLEEIEVLKGGEILHKGDQGRSLYIITEGEVRVHDGERTFAFLGDRDIFGEMSILDGEPVSADVTASKDTRLLRLDQDIFYELLADHVEIVRGILRTLTQRLRRMLHD